MDIVLKARGATEEQGVGAKDDRSEGGATENAGLDTETRKACAKHFVLLTANILF
jgi:hypothetical protein